MATFGRCLLVSTLLALTLSISGSAQEGTGDIVLSSTDLVTAPRCDAGEAALPDLDLGKAELAGGSCGLCFCGSCCQCPRRSNTGSCCADGGCTNQGDPVCLAVSQCTCISTDPEE